MSVGPLVVEIVGTFCLASALLYRYGNWSKHHAIVTLSVLIAWYFSLIIIFILPLDVSSTAYRQCLKVHRTTHSSTVTVPMITSPTTFASTAGTTYQTASTNDTERSTNITIHPGLSAFAEQNSNSLTLGEDHLYYVITDDDDGCLEPWSHIPDRVLPILWRIVYWTSQCLTWLILPLMQSYSQAGDFTVLGKLRSAVIDNTIYYGSYLLIFVILLVYIAASPNLQLDGPKLKVICITTSNTWGLFLLVLLLGYGLVEVPRSCWNSAKRGFLLNYTYFKMAKLNVEKSEAEDNVEDILDDIRKMDEVIRPTHPLRKHVETILGKIPESMHGFLTARHRNYDSSEPPFETPSERSLIRLHRQLIRALRIQHRTNTQWIMLIDDAIELEDLVRNETSSDHYFKPSFQILQPSWWRAIYTPAVEWYWKCLIRVWMMRLLAVVFALLSIFVVWSEVTFFNKAPVLSLFAIFVNLAKENYNYLYIEMVSCMTIAYLCVCAYYTIFKIRVLNYYYLAPYHQTDEYSLIFSGMLLCRLTPPLCLNFLGLIHLDSHITSDHDTVETSYTAIMGHMDVISFISDGFNIYFPIGILVLCLATYFRVGSLLLHWIGFQQFIGDDEMTGDLIEEGREIIKREKRKRQRNEEGEMRRRNYQEKFSGSAMYRTQKQKEKASEGKGIGIKREDSSESARAELLRDIEPVDYTGDSYFADPNSDYFRMSGGLSSTARGAANGSYQADNDSSTRIPYSSQERSMMRPPPRGIFDDV